MPPALLPHGRFLLGLALGAGAVAVAPRLMRAARPIARDAARAGKAGYEVARGAVVKAGEEVREQVTETAAGIRAAAGRLSDAVSTSAPAPSAEMPPEATDKAATSPATEPLATGPATTEPLAAGAGPGATTAEAASHTSES